MADKACKNGGTARRRYLLSSKNRKGVFNTHPPSGRGINGDVSQPRLTPAGAASRIFARGGKTKWGGCGSNRKGTPEQRGLLF